LDTLRQYGREQLLATGQAEAVHAQHSAYFLVVAERAEPELDQARQAVWMERLAHELSDLRTALDWLIERGEVQQALRLAGVLSRLWEVRGYVREGRERLSAVLALPGASEPTVARAKVLDGAGVLALYQDDMVTALALFKASLELYRQHQESHGVAWVLIHLGWACHDAFRYKAARRFLREALALCRLIDDRRGIARSLTLLGNCALLEADLVTACSLHEQGLALSREVGDRWGTAWTLQNLGDDLLAQSEFGQADPESAHALLLESTATWRELGERRHLAYANVALGNSYIWQGDFDRARLLLVESLTTFEELQEVVGIGWTFFNCAPLLVRKGRQEQAVRILGASYTLHVEVAQGRPIPRLPRSIVERRLESARGTLGTQIVEAAWSEGRAMSLNEAIAYTRQQLGVHISDI
jgi:tetratricopeptide (TPR) repeat protein